MNRDKLIETLAMKMPGTSLAQCREDAAVLEAAAEAAGYVLVPVEPTPAMKTAGRMASGPAQHVSAVPVWEAMLAAAQEDGK